MTTKRISKSTKGKGKDKDIPDRPCLAFTVLSEDQTTDLMLISSPDELEIKMCEYMQITEIHIDIKQYALLDFYVLAFHWAKSQQFTAQQVSGIFTLFHTLLENIREKHLSRTDNLKELKKLLAGVGIENPDITGGLDFLSVKETGMVAQYLSKSLFQQYNLYEYVFSNERKEEIVGLDLEVETAKPASIPWPPPLNEAISEDVYNKYIRTPSPTTEPETTELPEVIVPPSQDEQEAEIVSKLTADEIQSIIDSVCGEMLSGFETEVASKLRDQEISFINRINRIHKVAET